VLSYPADNDEHGEHAWHKKEGTPEKTPEGLAVGKLAFAHNHLLMEKVVELGCGNKRKSEMLACARRAARESDGDDFGEVPRVKTRGYSHFVPPGL
jgi:hypothetical protein